MAGRLEGKVAIITGGASGMGLASVERFVAEGARVVFCDLPPGGEEDIAARLGDMAASVHHKAREKGGEHDGWAIAGRLGDSAHFIPADVSDADALSAVVDGAVQRYGRLDIMFNNAGICALEGHVVDCPETLFDRTIAVDLKSVWLGIKFAAPKLMAAGGGSIISTASIAGLAGMPGLGAYSAAKAGVIGVTRAAAMELAAHNVRVNCICPGTIVTPIAKATFGPDFDVDMARAGALAAQPIPRVGEAEDIANAALFLASDESAFLTGVAMPVDGGATAEFNAFMRGGSVTGDS